MRGDRLKGIVLMDSTGMDALDSMQFGSLVKVFPGAGHECLLERWEEFNTDISAFLGEAFA